MTSTEGGIHVVDVAVGEKKVILPTKSMFGFDFVTKIVTLFDFSGTNASPDQPFGNLLPFMLLGSSDKGDMKDILPMMMLMGGMNGDSSPFGAINMNNHLCSWLLWEEAKARFFR